MCASVRACVSVGVVRITHAHSAAPSIAVVFLMCQASVDATKGRLRRLLAQRQEEGGPLLLACTARCRWCVMVLATHCSSISRLIGTHTHPRHGCRHFLQNVKHRLPQDLNFLLNSIMNAPSTKEVSLRAQQLKKAIKQRAHDKGSTVRHTHRGHCVLTHIHTHTMHRRMSRTGSGCCLLVEIMSTLLVRIDRSSLGTASTRQA